MKSIISSLFISLAAATAVRRDGDDGCPQFEHVAVFSVDGLHASDIDKWLALGASNISEMLENGYLYTDTYTTFPSGGLQTIFTVLGA